MRFDVVTELNPYTKIGFIYVPDRDYQHGDTARVIVKEKIVPFVPDEKISDTFTMKFEEVTVISLQRDAHTWIAIITDKPIDWWQNMQGFEELR